MPTASAKAIAAISLSGQQRREIARQCLPLQRLISGEFRLPFRCGGTGGHDRRGDVGLASKPGWRVTIPVGLRGEILAQPRWLTATAAVWQIAREAGTSGGEIEFTCGPALFPVVWRGSKLRPGPSARFVSNHAQLSLRRNALYAGRGGELPNSWACWRRTEITITPLQGANPSPRRQTAGPPGNLGPASAAVNRSPVRRRPERGEDDPNLTRAFCPETVAQSGRLPDRGLVIRSTQDVIRPLHPADCRAGDTAGWQPALRAAHSEGERFRSLNSSGLERCRGARIVL